MEIIVKGKGIHIILFLSKSLRPFKKKSAYLHGKLERNMHKQREFLALKVYNPKSFIIHTGTL